MDYITTASREGLSEDVDFPPLTASEIEANCMLIMLAGSETLATSLLASTYLPCQRPAILRRLAVEVRSVAKSEAEINSDLTASCMPYLNAVLREAHRLCPPLASGFARVVAEDGAIIAGQTVLDVTAVGVAQWAANRSAINFNRPDDFIPERWLLPEQIDNYVADDEAFHPDKFMQDAWDVVRPFSAGDRDCMGQNIGWVEFRLFLARMIWNFDIEPALRSAEHLSSFRVWSDQRAYLMWQKEPFYVVLKEIACKDAHSPVLFASADMAGDVPVADN